MASALLDVRSDKVYTFSQLDLCWKGPALISQISAHLALQIQNPILYHVAVNNAYSPQPTLH